MGKTLQTLRIVCFLQSYYKQQSLGLFLIRSCAVYNIQHNFGGAQSESAQTKHGIYGTGSEFKTDEHRLRCSGRSADRSSKGTDGRVTPVSITAIFAKLFVLSYFHYSRKVVNLQNSLSEVPEQTELPTMCPGISLKHERVMRSDAMKTAITNSNK